MLSCSAQKNVQGTYLGTYRQSASSVGVKHYLTYFEDQTIELAYFLVSKTEISKLPYAIQNSLLTRENNPKKRSRLGCVTATLSTPQKEGIREKEFIMNLQYKVKHLDQLFYSVSETAQLLGASSSHVYRLIKKGHLQTVKLMNDVRISANAIARYSNRLEAESRYQSKEVK